MELSKEQQSMVIEWINRHNPNYVCPFCGKDDFGVGCLIAPPSLSNFKQCDGIIIPLVPLVCNVCGHLTLFAADPIGIKV